MPWVHLFWRRSSRSHLGLCDEAVAGVTRVVPSAIMVVTMIGSSSLLSLSLKSLPLGIAYTI